MPNALFAAWMVLQACTTEVSRSDTPDAPVTSTNPSAGIQTEDGSPPSAIPERVAIRHILLAYSGSPGARMGTNRSRKEAQELAGELRARIASGETLADLARLYSDDGSKARGGFLGSSEAGAWVPEFEQAAFGLEVGEISAVVETQFGFHILQREPLQEVRLKHMIMQYHGASNLSGRAREERRTKEAASASANEALAALNSGEEFETVAHRLSDGPMGRRGEDLGWFTRGEIGPAFDETVFSLQAGETSGIIESPFGFHIVERVE